MERSITITNDFSVECLGEREEWVYDIEVEDNHNFFGNDILVHNSLYINMEPLVNLIFPDGDTKENEAKICDTIYKICDSKIVPIISAGYDDLGEYLNVTKQTMEMKREIIATNVLWQAKKRYMCNVLNSEGVPYDPPKLKIMGIESVKSSTPAICRSAIKETIRRVMQESEESVQEYVAQFKAEFVKSATVDIAKPSGINGLSKYDPGLTENNSEPRDKTGKWLNRTPIHVKAALIHNNRIKKLGLEAKHSLIREGEKIKMVYLKQPNPMQEYVIAFVNYMPPEFQLDKYIDIETQFEKTFLKPVESILEVIEWSSEETISLEDFFV